MAAGTADALFGAGSGNALTKITKYGTVVFLVLCLLLGYMHDKVHTDNSAADFAKQVQQKQMQVPNVAPPTGDKSAPASVPATQPSADNLLSTLPVATNAPAAK